MPSPFSNQALIAEPGSSFPVGVAGQPLFLQYQPDMHIRGQPADSFTWMAYDQYGARGNVSTISVNIQCPPGYRISEDDPGMCSPCPPGQYNMPDIFDQVIQPDPLSLHTCLMLSCIPPGSVLY